MAQGGGSGAPGEWQHGTPAIQWQARAFSRAREPARLSRPKRRAPSPLYTNPSARARSMLALHSDEPSRGLVPAHIHEAEVIQRHVHLDSRSRVLPSEGQEDYRVMLRTPLHGVRRVELLGMHLPVTEPTVPHGCGVLPVVVDPVVLTEGLAPPTTTPTRPLPVSPCGWRAARPGRRCSCTWPRAMPCACTCTMRAADAVDTRHRS